MLAPAGRALPCRSQAFAHQGNMGVFDFAIAKGAMTAISGMAYFASYGLHAGHVNV